MPKELRQVVFRSAEVIEAVTAYFRHRQLKLPGGNIEKFEVSDSPVTLTLHVMIPGEQGSEIRQLQIKTEELAAALILHCINNRIPLPAEASKSLRKVGNDQVSLFVVRESRH
jgi:hypothetical protein